MRFLFIINSSSGATRAPEKLALTIEQWLRESARPGAVRITGSLAALDQVWQSDELAAAESVVAVGGDGTVLEIARRLIGTRRHLGIVPLGSGNGFARHLGIPMAPLRALEALETAVPMSVDTGLADDQRFLGTFGVGFDAEVARQFATAGSRGLATYVRVGVTAFFRYEPQSYTVRVDGVDHEERGLLLTVGNSSQYGNEAKIIPNASLRDGLLDVCILRQATVADAPRLLTRLFEGRFDECAEVCLLQGREIEIVRSGPGPAHLDGDPVEAGAHVRVRVDPRSLSVLVPREAVNLI